jgi:hypothetical protein
MHNPIKHELHNIISGKSQVRYGATIQAVSSYLGDGSHSSSKIEIAKQIREQETELLVKILLFLTKQFFCTIIKYFFLLYN